MVGSRPYELVNCPHCQAVADAVVGRCWLCGEPLDAKRSPVRRRTSKAQEASAKSFGPATLVLYVALTAVVGGVFLVAPGLAIVLIVLATPALARNFGNASRRQGKGESTSGEERVGVLIGSIGTVVMAGVAAVAAVWVTCIAGFVGAAAGSIFDQASHRGDIGVGLIVGAVLGVLAGLVAAIVMFRSLRTRRK